MEVKKHFKHTMVWVGICGIRGEYHSNALNGQMRLTLTTGKFTISRLHYNERNISYDYKSSNKTRCNEHFKQSP